MISLLKNDIIKENVERNYLLSSARKSNYKRTIYQVIQCMQVMNIDIALHN